MHLRATGTPCDISGDIVARITTEPLAALDARADHVACVTSRNHSAFGNDYAGYAALFAPIELPNIQLPQLPRVLGCPNLAYVNDGDVLLMSPSGTVKVLYRKGAAYNAILVTERCNSLCVMCSQPPKMVDDSQRVQHILRLIDLIDPDSKEIGITGGEPTLLGDAFFTIIRKLKSTLPNTSVHVLSNGRLFKNHAFARNLGEIQHPDVMLGIPVYSDIDDEHDHVVQARGAFDETMLGLYNLAACEVPVEIRVVVHRLTYRRLPQLAEFICRNLPFAAHVALMGMEMYGYANLNFRNLWIDPVEYQQQLEEATVTLALHGMNVSIYNHQLCTIPKRIWPFTRKSISDWKNIYLDECGDCEVRQFCGGFFQSAAKRHSAHITPLRHLDDASLALLSRHVDCRSG